MIIVNVTTNVDGDVTIAFNSLQYNFLPGSKANYLPDGGILVLVDATGKQYNFHEDAYQFYINTVLWVGTFSALADEFNKNIFLNGVSPSPAPGNPVTLLPVQTISGSYLGTFAISVIGRRQIHFDFAISNGGTLVSNGCVIAIVQVSDDGLNWIELNNVVASTTLVADGAIAPYRLGTVFRQFTAEYAAIAIPYLAAAVPFSPPLLFRISYSTGYGKFYRLWVRASDTAGISSGAPATFPDLEIKATLQ